MVAAHLDGVVNAVEVLSPPPANAAHVTSPGYTALRPKENQDAAFAVGATQNDGAATTSMAL
jgi:hypothetical protein